MSAPSKSKCPLCGRPANPRFKPFCSGRCADLDLGTWLKGDYAIPGAPEEEQSEGPAGGQAPEEE